MNYLYCILLFPTLAITTLNSCKKDSESANVPNSNSKGFSIATLASTGKSLNTSIHTNNARDIELIGDSLIFIHSRGTNTVESFKLTNKGDLSSGTHIASFNASDFIGSTSEGTNGHGIYIKKNDLSRMWLFNRTEIWEFDFEKAGDLTAVLFSDYLDLSDYVERGHGIFFSPEGSNLYIDDRNKAMVHQFTLVNNWSIGSFSNYKNISIANYQEAVRSISFDKQGIKMFLLDTSRKELMSFKLTTPWHIENATYDKKKSLTISNPRGFTWNSNGTKAYIMNTDNGVIYEYAN